MLSILVQILSLFWTYHYQNLCGFKKVNRIEKNIQITLILKSIVLTCNDSGFIISRD